MDRKSDRLGRGSVAVPSFMDENKKNGGNYIERNTTSYNGYNQRQEVAATRQKLENKSRDERPERSTDSVSSNGNRTQRSSVQIRNRKKRKRMVKRILFSMLILVAVVTGHLVARIQTQVNNALNSMDRSSGIDLSNVQVNAANISTDNRIINILLVGADKRENWKEAGRSDSVMIATLDLKHKRLKITSLMRDMYVPIPEHGESKFNAAYSYGGVELLYQTIATNFGIKADGYAVVDFAAFKTVINTIGGVDVKLTQDEYEYLTTAYKKGSVLKLKPGLNKMDGNQALAYTRIRQDGNGDFGRTQRQRVVLQAIFKEAKSMSYSEVMDLANQILPNVATDLSNEEIISYLTSILTLGTTEIDQKRIPIDDSFTQDRINNMAVLIPDMAVNTNALQEFIYEYDGK